MENLRQPTFQEIDAWISSLEIKKHPYRKPIPGFPYMVVSVRSAQKGGKKFLYVQDVIYRWKIENVGDVGEFNGKNSEELFTLVKQIDSDYVRKQTKDYGFPEKGLPFDEPSGEENKESNQDEMNIREIEILKTPKSWIEKFLSFFVKGEKKQ